MKNVIISDIHGNVDALLAVIKEIAEKENNIERLLIAGDIVGYGASPNECCDIVRFLMYGRKKVDLDTIFQISSQPYFDSAQRDNLQNGFLLLEKKCIAVSGNHDREAVDMPSLTSEMNPVARTAIDWTKAMLTKENFKFLSSLSLRAKFRREGFEVVHSTPTYPQGYEYAKNASVLKYMTLRSKITFGGHTHRPSAYIYTKEARTVSASVFIPADNYDMRLMLIERGSTNRVESFHIDTEKEWKYYINVGSVGQPRDGNPHACYVVFDSVSKHLCFKRTCYNTEAASRRITEAQLPHELAQRVLKGV